MFRSLLLSIALMGATPVFAQEEAMTADRLISIIVDLDPSAQPTPAGIELTLEDIPVLVVFAPGADRMRAMVPIAAVEDVTPEEMNRMMQANFDTALDARYAVAQGRVWGVFIHPLAALEREQFISGLAQTVNLARTYGTLYSGGANVFGQGDSAQIYQELFEDLIGRGQDI
ncbi:polysaccharide deacetylase family protein [Pseudooctadecabacter jejudonensis]|uniref:Uncharacterized protein n=1 Tax=Pseudooctadecabacter jejudonensis TaxID=1391910 RepID=A0A1Y5SNQ2_9RHOB|nr:hypothetical protein [Pseudooctadecabacter jejudonensis]SLN44886.1 hypothetical protein PSJ8397_02338 [Pseudooctadecabacter jejudonensis]